MTGRLRCDCNDASYWNIIYWKIIIIIIIIIKLLFIIIIKILFNEKFIHLFIHVMAKFSSRVLYL